jgi:DUF4097 and DUF4098 domain-containing protein YvlB
VVEGEVKADALTVAGEVEVDVEAMGTVNEDGELGGVEVTSMHGLLAGF